MEPTKYIDPTGEDSVNKDSADHDTTKRGIIAWFARNNVAANLLMIFIIVGGLLTANTINKQMFPQVKINWIQFSAYYPGAAPQEVEEGITIKIEEALESVQGLDRVMTYSNRDSSSGYFRVEESYDPLVVLDEVKTQIDAIATFPAGMETPKVEQIQFKQQVMYLSLYGDLSHGELKEFGRKIHEEIQRLPQINISEFYGGLAYEVAVEVSKDKLREYQLSFEDIANAIRRHSKNISAGQIRAEDGYINIRVENQAYTGEQFEQIPVRALNDGTQLLLADVATVTDGFEQGLQYSKFNGKNSTTLFIGAAEDQSITDISATVKKYVREKSKELPEGVYLETWVDMTYYLQGRLDMMLDNMVSGAVLVFIMLALFLRIRLAFWVMMGLPVCFLGTLLLMPMEFINVTINITSLFAFILVLGIVVDDAIVMGESAHDEIETSGHSPESVIRGVQRVAMPATFGVLTTIAVFVPFVLGDGPSSAFSQSIGYVVILCLVFSLIESKLILPSHLVNMKYKPHNDKNPLDRLRNVIDNKLKVFIYGTYKNALEKCIKYRYGVLAFFISIMLISAGLFSGGFIRYVGQPKIPHDFPSIDIKMSVNASEKSTLTTALNVEKIIQQVDNDIIEQYGQAMVDDMQVELTSRTEAKLRIKLVDPELRAMNTFEVADLWRQAMPSFPGVKTFTIGDNLFGNQRDDGDISFKLESDNTEQLMAAANALRNKLNTIKGVGDINDNRPDEAKEVQFTLTPLAYSLGLTMNDVATQVGYSFYGLEAQRILRNTEEIRVMVRYPLAQRNSLGDVESVLIQTAAGGEIPLGELANITLVDGVTQIRREDGSRVVNVWANVDAAQVEPFAVAKDIRDNYLPELFKTFPSVTGETAGSIQEEIDGANDQLRDFIISLMVIFSLLAIPLRSYSQATMIMLVIPFGVIGAVFGHLMLGMDLNVMSVFGLLAAAGVVVNDSLVMVDYVNRSRKYGASIKEAVVLAGTKRFRAIMLTSITTFVGLAPIVFFESSMQALIVIPMAVSLAFGVLFATLVTLIFIPALYVIIEDIKAKLSRNKVPTMVG